METIQLGSVVSVLWKEEKLIKEYVMLVTNVSSEKNEAKGKVLYFQRKASNCIKVYDRTNSNEYTFPFQSIKTVFVPFDRERKLRRKGYFCYTFGKLRWTHAQTESQQESLYVHKTLSSLRKVIQYRTLTHRVALRNKFT